MYYFSLAPHIYASRFQGSIIILDSKSDNYISLIDPAANYLQYILEQSFTIDSNSNYISGSIDTEQLNYWINFFLEQNFIVSSKVPNSRPIASMPIKPGGLSNYQWDSKISWQPFKQIRLYQVLPVFWMLTKVRFRMWRKGILGLLQTIPQQSSDSKIASDLEIKQLADVVDAATYLYPKKTYCLAWAATFVALARKNGWQANLVIGVQAQPFYAHAWAEINGQVIHDDPIITQVLSIIMKY